MLKIKELICKMDDTLSESNWYAEHARLDKDTFPIIAETYYKLGQEHLNHYMNLHAAVVSVINEYKKTKGEVPQTMSIIYEYEHGKLMEEYDEIKKKLDSFRI